MVKKKMEKNKIISNSASDRIFDIANILICLILLVVFVWPLWFVVIASFSDPYEVLNGNVIFWLKKFNMEGYTALFTYNPLWRGYRNNIFYTAVGTCINMVMTVLCAYPLSRKDWMVRNVWMKYCLITMYFGGGLIPTYLVVKGLGMVNTVWAMMIPGALSFYNALIVRNYFSNSIPEALHESAMLDGASHATYLLKIVLPLSKPVLAVVALYYAVSHWNDYYTALIYIYNEELNPLQTEIRAVVQSLSISAEEMSKINTSDMMSIQAKVQLGMRLKYTSLIAGVIPMMIIYPFVQKYFVKGVMIGSIKG